jgi:hypothetical protein
MASLRPRPRLSPDQAKRMAERLQHNRAEERRRAMEDAQKPDPAAVQIAQRIMQARKAKQNGRLMN